MSSPVVFFDIAGSDDQALRRFYADVFGWNIGDDGQFTVTASAPLSAAIRRDPAEKRIYIGVEDVAAKLREIESAGGAVDAERFEVPGVVILGLFRDPAGNPMGLVELKDGVPRIP